MTKSRELNLAGKTGVLLSLRLAVPSIILLGSPTLTVDGLIPMKMGWGKEFVPLEAGKHEIRCRVHLFRALQTGEGRCEFEVPENTIVKLRWIAPLWITGRGWWKNLGPK
jgi:hypothetical protein